jgi:VanZ family protein
MPDASTPVATRSVAARWTLPVLWLAFILVGTSWPNLQVGVPVFGFDKIAHFIAYAVLAALSLRATLTLRRIGTLLAVVVAVSLLGAVDEWHQSFIPGRSMSFLDWCADTLGALAGALAVRYIPFLTPRRLQPL